MAFSTFLVNVFTVPDDDDDDDDDVSNFVWDRYILPVLC